MAKPKYGIGVDCATRGAGSPCDTLQEVMEYMQKYIKDYPDWREITIWNNKPEKIKEIKEDKDEEPTLF